MHMKKVFKDLKNTYITHWAVGSDRASPREYLTSNLFAIVIMALAVEFSLYLALGEMYWETDTGLAYSTVSVILFYLDITGTFSGWLFLLLFFQIFLSIPLICLSWRRLHDFDWSGWNMLWIGILEAIPYFSWLVILFMFLKKSNPAENIYGPPVVRNDTKSTVNNEEE